MRTILESAREIPVVAEVDVLVAGGGPAGIAAATAAARLGAQTLLVERYGHLGGLATGGIVLYMDALFDKQGQRCIGGVHWEALEHLRAMGGLAETAPRHLHVDSELLKLVADDLCAGAGVALRLHSWAVETLMENNRVLGVVVESKSGRQAILSRVCVDATGDGDVAARAGAAYDFANMRIGLNLKIGGVDLDAFRAFQNEDPQRFQSLRTEVEELGGCPIGANATPHSDLGVYWVNILGLANREGKMPPPNLPGGVFRGELSAVDVETLSFAEVELRRQIKIGLDFYRRHVPGYEDVRLLTIASQLGVRDSRRIQGIHKLTRAETEASVQFEDAIGMTATTYGASRHVQVPYRALVPAQVDGLLVGGRCISVDDGLINSLRLIPPAMMTGQAAGTAAALSAKMDVAPRHLDTQQLRRQLHADGVILPQPFTERVASHAAV